MSNLEALRKNTTKILFFAVLLIPRKYCPMDLRKRLNRKSERVMNILGDGGGYMLATVHTVMNEVPAENVLAMVDAVEEFGHYPLQG